jgi:hypothetical protein
MRMRLVVGSAALVLFASVVACSGGKSASDPTATDDPTQTATPGTGAGDPAAAAPAKDPQAAPSDAPPASTASDDGGAPEGSPGASPGAGGGGGAINPQCEATSVHESGSNDTAETANAIPAASGTFCGTLDSATDVDFVSFTLPVGTKSLGFGLAYSQLGVVVEGTAGGETFVVGAKPAFKPGATYMLKVRSSGTTPVSYLLSVDIQM